jgi:hypothetical protein
MLSPETIKRQVDREGSRWGIFGVIKDGKCFAAAMGREASISGNMGTLDDEPILICSVDEDHPFASVLAHRVQRGERDAMKRFRDAEARKRKDLDAQYESYAEPFRDKARWILNRPLRVPVVR